MADGRRPGRPRKVSDSDKLSIIPLKEATIGSSVPLPVSGSTTLLSGARRPAVELQPMQFDVETIARIRECDDIYLVCKNVARQPNGKRDKSIHDCLWLKKYYTF